MRQLTKILYIQHYQEASTCNSWGVIFKKKKKKEWKYSKKSFIKVDVFKKESGQI